MLEVGVMQRWRGEGLQQFFSVFFFYYYFFRDFVTYFWDSIA